VVEIQGLKDRIEDLKEQIEFLKSLIKVGSPVPGLYDAKIPRELIAATPQTNDPGYGNRSTVASDRADPSIKPQTPVVINKSWSNIRTRLQEAERGNRGEVDEAIKESIVNSLGGTSGS
jgi:hypothetical protein